MNTDSASRYASFVVVAASTLQMIAAPAPAADGPPARPGPRPGPGAVAGARQACERRDARPGTLRTVRPSARLARAAAGPAGRLGLQGGAPRATASSARPRAAGLRDFNGSLSFTCVPK